MEKKYVVSILAADFQLPERAFDVPYVRSSPLDPVLLEQLKLRQDLANVVCGIRTVAHPCHEATEVGVGHIVIADWRRFRWLGGTIRCCSQPSPHSFTPAGDYMSDILSGRLWIFMLPHADNQPTIGAK